MAGNSVTIDAKLNESGVTAGAKKIKVSLEEIKKADGSLNWSGVKEGEDAAKKSGDGFTVLKGILANLATQGIMVATAGRRGLLQPSSGDRSDLRDLNEQGERPLRRYRRRSGHT